MVVGTGDELFGHRVELEEVNWLVDRPLGPGDACEVQARYRARAVAARVAPAAAGGDGGLTLELVEPVRAVTPGQSGVLYDGRRLLGGGVIT